MCRFETGASVLVVLFAAGSLNSASASTLDTDIATCKGTVSQDLITKEFMQQNQSCEDKYPGELWLDEPTVDTLCGTDIVNQPASPGTKGIVGREDGTGNLTLDRFCYQELNKDGPDDQDRGCLLVLEQNSDGDCSTFGQKDVFTKVDVDGKGYCIYCSGLVEEDAIFSRQENLGKGEGSSPFGNKFEDIPQYFGRGLGEERVKLKPAFNNKQCDDQRHWMYDVKDDGLPGGIVLKQQKASTVYCPLPIRKQCEDCGKSATGLTAGSCKYTIPPFLDVDGIGICQEPNLRFGLGCEVYYKFDPNVIDCSKQRSGDCADPGHADNTLCDPEVCQDDLRTGDKTSGGCYYDAKDGKDTFVCLPKVSGKCMSYLEDCKTQKKTKCDRNSVDTAPIASTQAPVTDKYQCSNCVGGGTGECSVKSKSDETQFLCYGYAPKDVNSFEPASTDESSGEKRYVPIEYDDFGVPDQLSGPQCYPGLEKCQPWEPKEATTAPPQVTTAGPTTVAQPSTTAAPPQTKPPPGVFQNNTKDLQDDILESWKKFFCYNEQTAIVDALADSAMVDMLSEMNTAIVSDFLSNGYHYQESVVVTETFGADTPQELPYDKCAGNGETCTCKGFVSFAPSPSVSWGSFNCTGSTFGDLKPSASNPDGSCYCLSFENVAEDEALPTLTLNNARNLYNQNIAAAVIAERVYTKRNGKRAECPGPKDQSQAQVMTYCAAKGVDCRKRNQQSKVQKTLATEASALLPSMLSTIFYFDEIPGSLTYDYLPELSNGDADTVQKDMCDTIDGQTPLCGQNVSFELKSSSYSTETMLAQVQYCPFNGTKDNAGLCHASCNDINCVAEAANIFEECSTMCNLNLGCNGFILERSVNDTYEECLVRKPVGMETWRQTCTDLYGANVYGVKFENAAIKCTTVGQLDKGVGSGSSISYSKQARFPTVATTQTTTGTSSASTTNTKTVVTTPTNTATTTPSTTGTTTPTTTGSSSPTTSASSFIPTDSTSVSSTATHTEASTASSTATRTEATSPTTTPTTTQTTSATVTITESFTTTETSTASMTFTSIAPDYMYKRVYQSGPEVDGPQRRFGNAFSGMRPADGICNRDGGMCDRLFIVHGEGNDKEAITTAAKERCTEDRDCLAVFVWKQQTHVEQEYFAKNNKPNYQHNTFDSYAAVGLKAGNSDEEGVYGNYFSYDATAAVSVSGRNLFMKMGKTYSEEFESESWVKVTTCPAEVCSYYSGPCVHPSTGFCMSEEPGTARCLVGFEHCNNPNTLNPAANKN